MTNILVTGGTGFLGSALVKKLINKNNKVFIFDNNFRGNLKNIENLEKKIKFIKGDIRNPNLINNALKGIDVVYHLAFINGTSNFYKSPKLVLDVGIRGTLNLMDSINKNKSIKKFIYASSSEVYQNPTKIPTDENERLIVPNPHNPRYSYGGGKIISELLCINYGKKYFKKMIIFRPHNVFGPDMGWEHVIPQLLSKIKKRKKNTITFQGSGNESRAFIHIDDFCNAFYMVYKKGKHLEIYNIGNDKEIKIINLLKTILKKLRLKININKVDLQKGSPKRRCPNIYKIKKLGYKPNYNLEESLSDSIEWYIENS